jgi:hypothetical protein
VKHRWKDNVCVVCALRRRLGGSRGSIYGTRVFYEYHRDDELIEYQSCYNPKQLAFGDLEMDGVPIVRKVAGVNPQKLEVERVLREIEEIMGDIVPLSTENGPNVEVVFFHDDTGRWFGRQWHWRMWLKSDYGWILPQPDSEDFQCSVEEALERAEKCRRLNSRIRGLHVVLESAKVRREWVSEGRFWKEMVR